MPVIKFEETAAYSWAVWEIIETEQELYALSALTETEDAEFTSIRHKEKRKEYLAGRLVLKFIVESTNTIFKGIYKDTCGKPHLRGSKKQISMSHSFPFATAIVHQHKEAGIDIEKPQSKLATIAPKFLSAEEIAASSGDPKKLCIYWSAKEALYKIYGRKKVTLNKEIAIASFPLEEQGGFVVGTITMPDHKKSYTLRYVPFKEYIICFNQ